MRTKKLIQPGLQLRLTSWFLAIAVSGLLLQFLVISAEMSTIATDSREGALGHFERYSDVYLRTFAISMGIVLPLTLLTGILTTFRIAGPLYRLTRFLEEIRDGRASEACRLRKGDELHEFCALLNEVTEPLRRKAEAADAAPDTLDEAPSLVREGEPAPADEATEVG